MKKLVFFLLFCGLYVLGIDSLSAQIVLKEVVITGKSTKAVVTKEVSESFSRLFKDAVAPEWYEVNKRYVVNFIYDDQRNRAVFTKGGSLVYHMVYAAENEIPEDVKSRVKSKYSNYDITFAVKVEQDDRKVWIINVENEAKILVLRIEEDDMIVLKNLKKS